MLNEKREDLLLDQTDKRAAHLMADIKLQLHTRVAQSLFNGSWKKERMGLLQFATLIHRIWNAAEADDPYAEWFLLKTYQALSETHEQVKSIEATLTTQFKNMRGVEINPFISTAPMSYPLKFATPFAYMGAYLLVDVDYVIRQLLTLERMGITLPTEDINVKLIIQCIQRVFAVPRGWQETGVTRQDIHANNEKAQYAKSKLGELLPAILNRTINLQFLPKAKKVHDAK